ncbi:alpha/beta hydrolase [Eubacteriales bacterium DFI.9.88]|jgi:pimeloyl-ACP methyl ester carboxylesterase|uniref:Alpha/beta hydrolase n=2 Tax=Clostridia TaxID=186801 RepID=A0A9J6QVC2_9FIRM|nr:MULTISPECIES: alpha/beta hydrolase [Clostridia]MCB7320309.1 alpha/beta hydrolase [Lacrimispora sp. 210928-DFI.3.58]MCU7379103.1 alpha/beta hydrolase [Hominibacterium faecale]MDE8734802.1 alpha/beta hydrolase [Eubacteriales bacterium DFI.9.88]ODM04329.1 putative aminoacrylate hydrolase RutD [Eisenbergiella tayi]
MKTILLHGLGQTAQDWKEVVCQLSSSNVECPELFSSMENEISYPQILGDLERRYSNAKEPLRICGLSLGALLAIDFAIRHGDKVASLVLIGTQYKVPSLLIDFQNLIFRCMPNKAFESMGLSKSNTIKLAHSMRALDFTAQLSGILCPVNILCGEKDSANLKASKKLNEILPKATLQIVPGAGHEINKDAPEAIAAILNM